MKKTVATRPADDQLSADVARAIEAQQRPDPGGEPVVSTPKIDGRRCGSCLHWGEVDGQDAADEFRVCDRIRHEDVRGDRDPAYVIDREAYAAALMTRSDFGCTLYSELPEDL